VTLVVVLLSLISSRVQATKWRLPLLHRPIWMVLLNTRIRLLATPCAQCLGADLCPGFWSYSFHHFIHLYNVTLHCGSDKTPYEICSGNCPNLRHLRTFGCRVYARQQKHFKGVTLHLSARIIVSSPASAEIE
jgi:hypothetical protein